MGTSYDRLHWLWPFPSKTWVDGDGESHTIVADPQKDDGEGNPVIQFTGTADDDIQFLSPNISTEVIAPISGMVTTVNQSDLNEHLADVEILTVLDDGTRIFNTLKGVYKLNPDVRVGSKLKQGEVFGLAGFSDDGDTPDWYTWVQLPGQKGLTVWAGGEGNMPLTLAAKGQGISWKNLSTNIPEFTPADQMQGPRVSPQMEEHDREVKHEKAQAELNLIGIGLAAAAAWFLFGKKGDK